MDTKEPKDDPIVPTEESLDIPETNNHSISDSEDLDNQDLATNPNRDQKEYDNPEPSFINWIRSRLNIYVAVFSMLLLASIIGIILLIRSNQDQTDINFDTTTLSDEELAAIGNQTVVIGSTKQNLTIESNSTFNGSLLVRDNLDVAGSISIGNSLSIPELQVLGDGSFQNLNIEDNALIGASVIVEGNTTLNQDLTVNGQAIFAEAISAPSLAVDVFSINDNLTLAGHLVANGVSPSIQRGDAVGSGGTVNVNGTDFSGTVNLNVGGSPSAGVLARINFVDNYDNTPQVIITPVGSQSAGIRAYVIRDTTGFSIGTIDTPNSATTYTFDYIIVQ